MEINLPVPPRIHTKLTEIAGFLLVEEWIRNVLIRAAEEARPSLTTSVMWRGDIANWRVTPEED